MWWVKFAPAKCIAVMINDNRKKSGKDASFKLYGEPIPKATSTTLLGITFNSKNNFDENIDRIDNVCRQRLNILKVV